MEGRKKKKNNAKFSGHYVCPCTETVRTHALHSHHYGDEEILPASVIDKLKDAPLTSSACESQFADIDNSVKKFGGTETVGTLSDKNLIKKNKFFE